MRAVVFVLAIMLLLPWSATDISPRVHAGDAQQEALPAAAPVTSRLSGPQPFITILCKFADVGDEPLPPSYFEALLGAAHPGLDDYWREVSYGQINLEGSRVVGWYTLPHPTAAYRRAEMTQADLDVLAGDCIATAAADVHFPDFAGINLVFNQPLDLSTWGGRRCLDLDGETRCYGITWLWPDGAAKLNIVVHETGHAFGLKHSSAGSGEVYGNLWDAMSATKSCELNATGLSFAPHVIAYDKDTLGWIPADRKLIASPQDTVTVALAALANPAAQGYLLAQVPIAGAPERFYTVEARMRVGYDRALPADAVLIHEVEPDRDPPARLVNHLGDGDTREAAGMWQPGDVFLDAAGGVEVSVDSATATGFIVTIATGSRPWPLASAGSTTLPAGDIAFKWQPVPRATAYELQVTPQSPLSAVSPFNRSVADVQTTITLPAASYRWQVRALPDGDWTPPIPIVTGFAGRRWLPSEVVSEAAGTFRSGLAITVDPRQGASIAWAATDSMFLPLTLRRARRRAEGWQLAEQTIRDYDLQTGSLPVLAVGAGDEICGLWIEQPPTVDGIAARTQGLMNKGLWFDCWTITQAPSNAEAAAGEPRTRTPPAGAIRINNVENGVRLTGPVLALDRAGNAFAAWNGARDSVPGLFFARRPADRSWEPEEKITDGVDQWALWSPAVAVDGEGHTHAIWSESRDHNTDLYSAVTSTGSGWGPSIQMSDQGSGSRINPTIAVDDQGSAFAAWQRFYGCAGGNIAGDIEFARQPAGGGWERPVRVSADIGSSNASPPVIAAGPEGTAYLVWEEQIAGRYVLYSSFRPADGAWEPKTPIPDAAGNLAPARPALTVDTDGNAYVTWLDTRAEQPVIRLARTAE